MAVNCAACGTSMAVAEVTQRPYDGVVGNYHHDCAYMEYLFNSGAGMSSVELGIARTKLHAKRNVMSPVAIAAPGGATASGAVLGVGVYKYAVTFVDKQGETLPGTQFSITTTTANTNVGLTGIPLHPSSTLIKARKIYRTAVAGSQLKLLTTLNDNTTTTFTDNIADASLGANAPVAATFAVSDFP